MKLGRPHGYKKTPPAHKKICNLGDATGQIKVGK
jgi:hypothetical protein